MRTAGYRRSDVAIIVAITLPTPATLRQGIAGCRSLSVSVRWRLVSKMISTPRWTAHCFFPSAEILIRESAHDMRDTYNRFDDVHETRSQGRVRHQKARNAAASISDAKACGRCRVS